MIAPSKYWYVSKNGTPVVKYDTSGKTYVEIPGSLDVVACDTIDDLKDISTDKSVLTQDEMEILGY